jgi:hypothetical protein
MDAAVTQTNFPIDRRESCRPSFQSFIVERFLRLLAVARVVVARSLAASETNPIFCRPTFALIALAFFAVFVKIYDHQLFFILSPRRGYRRACRVSTRRRRYALRPEDDFAD